MDTLLEQCTPGGRTIRFWESISSGVNAHNVSIGLVAAAFYAFSASPSMFKLTASMGLSTQAQVSWYAGTFFTSALTGIVLSWRYRIPLPMGWSLPGLLFLVSSATSHSHAEMIGGVIVAGLAIIAIGLSGVADRIVAFVPLPVATGVFAGTVFAYVSAGFGALSSHPMVSGLAIGGFFAAMTLRRQWLPPMALALVGGTLAAGLSGELGDSGATFAPAVIAPVLPEFSPQSTLAMALPLVLMSIGLGNLQGLAILKSEGFDPPVRVVTVATGIATLVNAFFGGHVASLQSNGTAIMASDGAGPKESRYVSTLIASIAALVMALAAGSIGAMLGIIPAELVTTLAGLALLTVLLDALRKTVSSDLPMSGFVAMMVASSSMSLLGLGSALWGFVAGIAVSHVVERRSPSRKLAAAAGVSS